MLIGTAPILTHNYAIIKAGIFSHVIVTAVSLVMSMANLENDANHISQRQRQKDRYFTFSKTTNRLKMNV